MISGEGTQKTRLLEDQLTVIIANHEGKKKGHNNRHTQKHNEFKLRMERHLEIKFDVGTNEEIHAIELIL